MNKMMTMRILSKLETIVRIKVNGTVVNRWKDGIIWKLNKLKKNYWCINRKINNSSKYYQIIEGILQNKGISAQCKEKNL
jgi:hypothetical protein